MEGLEVPKINSLYSDENKKKYVIIAHEDLPNIELFSAHGKVLVYESWFSTTLENQTFDYFLCDTRKSGALEYLKCAKLEKYNVIYYTVFKNRHRVLTEKFRSFENVNVVSVISENSIRQNFNKLLMFGASVKDVLLDEDVQKVGKSLFRWFARRK